MSARMEAWMGGLAVDSKSREEVVEALDGLYKDAEFRIDTGDNPGVTGEERALIISGSKGWTAVYLEQFEQDEAVAAALSKTLGAVVLVHRAELYEAFSIAAFLDGELVDRYASRASEDDDLGLDELDELGFDAELPEDPSFDDEAGEGGLGDPRRIAALVPRVDAAALGAIYERCRSEPGGPRPDEAVIARSLKELRSVLGIGTLEHDFTGLWSDGERLGLRATYRAYKAPRRRLRDVWAGWRLKVERSRDSLMAPARQVRDRLRSLRPSKSEEADTASDKPSPTEPEAAPKSPSDPRPDSPPDSSSVGPGLRPSDDEPIPPDDP